MIAQDLDDTMTAFLQRNLEHDNTNKSSTMHESCSSLGTWTDDYGEEDFSLQCYRNDESAGTVGQPFPCDVPQQDANKLLEQRLSEMDSPVVGTTEYLISRSGSRTLLVDDLRSTTLELKIRSDATKDVLVLSTVVHKLKVVTVKNKKHHLCTRIILPHDQDDETQYRYEMSGYDVERC